MLELFFVLLVGVFLFTIWVVTGHGIWCLLAAIFRHASTTADDQEFDVERDLEAATRLIELASFKGWIESREYAELRSKLLHLRDNIEVHTPAQAPAASTLTPKDSQPPTIGSTATLVEEPIATPTFQHPLEQDYSERDYADQTKATQASEAISLAETSATSSQVIPDATSSNHEERAPKYTTSDLIRSFMERSNIRWIELISAALIVCCSVGLVISLWNTLSQTHRLVPSIAFLLASVGVHGAGQYTLRRWKLRQTSRGILHVALMLIPLSVLVSVLLVSRSESQLVLDAVTTTTLALASLVYVALASTAARALHGRHWRQLCGLSIVPAFAVVLIYWIGQQVVGYDYIVGGVAFTSLLVVLFDCKLSSLSSLQKPSATSRRTLIRHYALLVHASYASALVAVFAIVQWDESARLWQTLQLCFGILCVTSLLWCWQLLADGFSLVRNSLSSQAEQPALLVRRLTVTKSLFEVTAWLIGFTSGALFLYCTWAVTGQRPLFLGILYIATAVALFSGIKFTNRNILKFAATGIGIAVAVTLTIPFEYYISVAEEIAGVRTIAFWTGLPFILSLTLAGIFLLSAAQLQLIAFGKRAAAIAVASALRFSGVLCIAWCTAVTAVLASTPWTEGSWHSVLLFATTSIAVGYLILTDCRSTEASTSWQSGVMWLACPLAVVSVSRLSVHIPEHIATWFDASARWPLAWLSLAIGWSLLSTTSRRLFGTEKNSVLPAGLQLGALGIVLVAVVQLSTSTPGLFPIVCLGWVLPIVMICCYLHTASRTLANLASLALIAWIDIVCWHFIFRSGLYESFGFIGTLSILSTVALGLCLMAEWIFSRSSRLKEHSFVLSAVLPVSLFLSLTCLAAIGLPLLAAIGRTDVAESPIAFISNLAVIATFISLAMQITAAWFCRPHQQSFADPFLRLLIPLNLVAILIASTGAVMGIVTAVWLLTSLCLASGFTKSYRGLLGAIDSSRLELLYTPSFSLLFAGSAACFLNALTCAVDGPVGNFNWDTLLWSFPLVALMALQTAKAATAERRTWSTYGLAASIAIVIWLITLNQLSPGRPFWINSLIPGALFLLIEICVTLGCVLLIKQLVDASASSNEAPSPPTVPFQLSPLFAVFLVANALLGFSTILLSVAEPSAQLTNDLLSAYGSLWIPLLFFLALIVTIPRNSRFDDSSLLKIATPLIPLFAVWISQAFATSGWFAYRLVNGLLLVESIAFVALVVRSSDRRPKNHFYGLQLATIALTSFSIYTDPFEQWPLGMLMAIIFVTVATSFLLRDNIAIHLAGVLAGAFLFLLLRHFDFGQIEALVFSMYGPALVSLTYLVGPYLSKLLPASSSRTVTVPRLTLHRSTTISICSACLAITFGELLAYRTLLDYPFVFVGIPLVATVLVSLAFFFPHDLGLLRIRAERLRGTTLFLALSTFNILATFKLCLASGLDRDTTFVICIASQSLLTLGLAMLLREISNYGPRDLAKLFGKSSDRISTTAHDAFGWIRGFNFGYGLLASLLCGSLVLTSDVAMVRRIAALLPLLAAVSDIFLRKERSQHSFAIWTLLSSSVMFSLATLPYPLLEIPLQDGWAPLQRILATTIGLSWLIALMSGRSPIFDSVQLRPLNALTTTVAFMCGILLPILAMSTDSSLPQSPLLARLATQVLLGLLVARLVVIVLQRFEIDQTLDVPQRQLLVALCQSTTVSFAISVWLCFPEVFSGWFVNWWPIGAIATSVLLLVFTNAFTCPLTKRLLRPVEISGMVIPAGTVALCWLLATIQDGPVALWGQPRLMSVLLLLVALLYGWCAIRQTAIFLGVLSALSLLGSFWCALASQPDLAFFKHPQFWLLPPAALALVFTEWNRNQLASSVVTATRYFCALLIYFSSTAEMLLGTFDGRIWPPIVLLAVSLVGVFAGISMRIRAFLYCSTSFVVVAVLGMVWQAQRAIEQSWPWWAFGIVVGAGLIAGLGYIEKNREWFNDYIKSLESWEA